MKQHDARMTAADPLPHFVFGQQTGVRNSLCYLEEETIIFPTGNNCVLFNVGRKCQQFIPASLGFAALAISPDRRYLAVSERCEEGSINVYDMRNKNKQRMTLSVEGFSVKEFVCLAFSHDCKYLIAQSGNPHWTLFYWMWKRQEFIAKVKTGNRSHPIHQVSFHPVDSSQICVTGKDVFKLFSCNMGVMTQINTQKLDPHNFLSHVWMSETELIVGTEMGRLLVFESGKLLREMEVEIQAPAVQDSERSEVKKKVGEQDELNPLLPSVMAITAYRRGFACSAGPGVVCLFERTEEDQYRKARQIRIPLYVRSKDSGLVDQQEILSLCVSPSKRTLVASTDQGQLYSFNLTCTEENKHGDQAKFEFLTHSFHRGPIKSLSVCILKTLVVTCSLDRSVRVWNFKTNTLELYKDFEEEPRCVSFHPTGLFILVGFPLKLRLLSLLIDDIKNYKKIRLSGCTACAFSNRGHLFAAVCGDVIHIHSAVTCESILTLKGHTAQVSAIDWCEDDSRLASCDLEGTVFKWNTLNGNVESKTVHKNCEFTGVSISPTTKTIFAVGTDYTLKEIQGSQILSEVAADTDIYTAVALSRAGHIVFCGTSTGKVTAMKCPLSKPNTLIKFQGHAVSINKMVVTFDDQFLLSISDDGCLLIWKIVWNKYGLQRETDISYLEEILITKSDLETKNMDVALLRGRVMEYQMGNEYQLQLRDMKHKRELKEVKERLTLQINSFRNENQVLVARIEKLEVEHKEFISELIEKHSKAQEQLETSVKQKVIQESEMSHALQLRSQKIQEDHVKELTRMEESHKQAIEELVQQYEAKLEQHLAQLKEWEGKGQQEQDEYEMIIKLAEEDTEKLILEIRTTYEAKLKEKRALCMQLRDAAGVMRKRISRVQKDIGSKVKEIKQKEAEIVRMQGVVKGLEHDKKNLKMEIKHRNGNLEEKEIQIINLRNRIKDLESYKIILGTRAKDLQNQIEPKNRAIGELKDQVKKMGQELLQYENQDTQQKLSIESLTLRLKASHKDFRKEIQRARNSETLVQRFQNDLHRCANVIHQPKKLKETVLQMYQRYIQHRAGDFRPVYPDEVTEACQWELMEDKMAAVKSTMAQDSKIHNADRFKMMKDNAQLIMQINSLSEELALVKNKVREYEKQLSVNCRRKKSRFPAIQASVVLSTQPISQASIFNAEESDRIIQLQRMEIAKLRGEIETQEFTQLPRPPHRSKLPPIVS